MGIRRVGGMEVAELPLVLFAAVRAEDAPERPDGQAGRTLQTPLALGPLQHRQLWQAATERAPLIGLDAMAIRRRNLGVRQRAGVGLEQRFGEELVVARRAPVAEQHLVDDDWIDDAKL